MRILILKNSINQRDGFTIIELLFSIIILGVLVSSSMIVLDLLQKENEKTFDIALQKIDFETTRLFLETKTKSDKDLEFLTLEANKLFYQNNLLMENVESFSKTQNINHIAITICQKQTDTFCTEFFIQN